VRANRPLEIVRAFGNSLSTGEKLVIVLALSTLVLVVTYFSA
jgi:hypothetical protein